MNFALALCSAVWVAAVGASPPPQIFLREPIDQTAIQNEHVTLPCRVQNKRGMLQWTRDGFGLGVERNLTGFDRYHMSGSDEEGDFTLDINPVLLEDDAMFQCQVGAAEGVAPIRSQDAKLIVTVPPEPPVILNGRQLKTTEDREVEIKCSSRGGKPAAEITWLDGVGAVISEDIEAETEEVENTKLVTAISTLTMTAKKSDHNTTITCQAQNLADRQPKSTSIHLLVEYAPHVIIKVDRSPVFESDTVVFTCEAHANPPETSYRWFMNGEIVPGNHGTEHRISGLNRRMHNTIVKCEVSNLIGKSEETETLDVHYAPEFVRKPRDFSGERGKEATLRCQVDGNPTPTYTWFRSGDYHTVHSYEGNLTVRISEKTVGKYICRSSVQGFPEVTSSAEILMKGPPKVIRKDEVQFGREGSNVELKCDTLAIPPPNTIHWSLYGFPLDMASGHYRTIEKARKDGMLSTLVIRNSILSDFGDYNCTVRNPLGDDSMVIALKKEKSLPLIIILSAVIGGIVLTVAVILIMIICRKSSALSLKAMGNVAASGVNEKAGSSSVVSSSSKPPASSSKNNHLTIVNENAQHHYLVDDGGGKPAYDQEETDGEAGWTTDDGNADQLIQRPFEAGSTGYNDGYGAYGAYPMRYGHQPLPPPMHPHRYPAQYGNPYYRPEVANRSPLLHPTGGSRAYATLSHRNNRSYSPGGHASRTAVLNGAADSYGTLGRHSSKGPDVVKGKHVANNGGRVLAVNGNGADDAAAAASSRAQKKQYIMSPESEVDPSALATHV